MSVIPDRHRFRYKDKINALEKQLNQQQAKPVDDEEIVRCRTSLVELRRQINDKDADIARLQQRLQSTEIEDKIVGEWQTRYNTAVQQAAETERGLQNQLHEVHQKLVEARKDLQAGTEHLRIPLEKLFFLARRVHLMALANDHYPDAAKDMWSKVQAEWKDLAKFGPNIDYINAMVRYIKLLLWKQFPAWDRVQDLIGLLGVVEEEGTWNDNDADQVDDEEVNNILKDEEGLMSRKPSTLRRVSSRANCSRAPSWPAT